MLVSVNIGMDCHTLEYGTFTKFGKHDLIPYMSVNKDL